MDIQAKEYLARINRVIDHIHENIDKPMTVGELAEVASFSPFHFHRIFSALLGETVVSFLQRKRVERAATVLLNNPSLSITAVALDHGFSGSASFARLFKQSFAMSASEFRKGGYERVEKLSAEQRKNGKTNSKDGKELENGAGYIGLYREDGATYSFEKQLNTKRELAMNDLKNVNVTVENRPEMTIAYIRHIGPYKGNVALFGSLWGRMMQWAGPRNLLAQKDMKALSIYHDNPEITDEENLMLDICITVPEDTEVSGEVGKRAIEAGKYAVAYFEIQPEQYEQAWNYVYGTWLPESGYEPTDGPCYEECLNDPEKDPEGRHVINICVPVQAM